MEKANARFGKRFLAMVLALAMIIGLLPAYGFAAENDTASAMIEKVADPTTVNTYQDLLGAFADGNRYAGRLWTDKSVFDNYDALAAALGGELTADQLAQLTFSPEEFLIAYSALGSTTSVSTEMVVRSDLDVVIVLDNSGSMRSTVTNADGERVTRLQAVVDAANGLISGILENPSNRLSLVAYSADASLLLELDRYGQTDTCLTNSSGQLSAKADSLTDSSSQLQGNSITAHQTGTNVQSGINEAMKILYNAENTEGRTPVVIVMTDGAANYAAYQDMLGDTSGDGNYKQPGSGTTADVALSTLLNAAYWKYMLDVKYDTETVVYTVGVDVEELDDASLVLDPGAFFNAASTSGFSSVALNMLELYTEWSESNSAVTGTTSGRGNSRYTWTFPQPATEAIKTGIENHIVYSDKYYEVNSVALQTVFDDILTSISSLQEAFEAIEKTDITNGESSMVYVDFVGDYMELKDFKGISLYGQFYHITLESTNTTANGNGTVTAVSTYQIVDNGQTITDPITGEAFLLSENVIIELKHTYAVDANGNRTSAGEQDLWIHIDEQVLPLIYHKVETENGVTTYTVYDEVPVRFFYTVGVSEYVIPAGNLLLHRIDEAYLAANTGSDGTVYFYANQYFAQDDDETLVNHTQASGYGDAHNAVTPDTSNRYYIHQYNYPIYISIVDANGQPITMDPDTYGTPYNSSYVTTVMTYADIANLTSTTRLYTDVTFHAPTGSLQQTTADGGKVYAGQSQKYYVFTQWGHLLEDVIFYDSVNGVYINADGTTDATRGVWNENYTYEQYLDAVAAYLAATDGVSAEDLEARMAIGSWRIPRFANRTFAKESNPTGTATLRVAPVRDTDDETDHEGSIVAWLGNNGRVGYTAQTPKTVTDENGNDIDGELVIIGDVLTYTITATNYEDAPATIVITDSVPVGTEYVTGSADNNGVYANGKLTWTLANVPVGETVTVSYQVEVTGESMSVIENTAYITIGNNPAYETNTTTNPPVGKTSSSSQYTPDGQVQVGDILTYTIYYHNNTDATAAVTITDTIPAGTTYVTGSASYNGTDVLTLTKDSNGTVTTLTWVIGQVPAGQSGSVHFQVRVNADAVNLVENAAEITVGNNGPIVVTNKVVDELAYGDLTLSKIVATGNAAGDNEQYFTLELQSAIAGVTALNGTFAVSGSSKHSSVTFTSGAAHLQIKHGETITIHDLPAGITVTVYEKAESGYTPVYSADYVTIVADETVAVEITNIYNVTPTSVTLVGNKIFTGMNLDENMFSFLVYDANGDVVAGATNAADGTITFSTIHYATAGTYVYTVVETNTGATGVTYDTTVYTVQVEVVDNGEGALVASVTYPQGGLVFENTYTPKEVNMTLEGTKYLSGAAADGIAAGEFSFSVYAYDMANGTIGELVSAGATLDGQTSAAISFAPIGFNLADMTDAEGNILASKDFYFLVVEDIPGANGPTFDPNMYYDATEYLVKVTVRYDAEQGVLSVSEPVYSILGGSAVESLTFENIQNPNSVEIAPVGTKTTSNAPDGVTFSFSVINTANGKEAGVGVGAANGEIAFTTLSFTQPGTYVYSIQESNAGNTTNGITYDDAVYTMTVVVTRDATNKLVASVTYTDAEGNAVTKPAFHNEYHAAGFINITAMKQLDGRDLNAGEFAFKLVRQDNGGQIDGIVAADGTITFATMYYSLADIPAGQSSVTIHYVMSEVIPAVAKLSGVTYDTAEYDVYITIVDNDNGTISAFLSDKDGNALSSATDTGITFKNSYSVTTGTEVTIEVEKSLTGRHLKAGEFSFALFRFDGASGWKNVGSAFNAADGTVSFTRYFNASTLDNLAFEGSYTVLYRIDEVNNHLGGVQYDTDSIYVQVVIRHDEETASYVVDSIGYYSDEACQNALTDPAFQNIYTTTETSVIPQANKVLSGRDLEAGEFSFVITDAAGNVVSYGTNDANGNISFGAIGFDKAGTYTFTMKEVSGSMGGIRYDGNAYTFTVTVVDNGDGTLTATATYPDGGITFTNTYNAKPVTVYPNAMKILDGKTLEGGDFVFVLTDAQGNVIETVKNDATGAVAFTAITYTQPGTYQYTIYEQAGGDDRYTYSATVYHITVEVFDDGEGNLYANYHIYREGVEVGAVTFYNKYVPNPVTMDLNDAIDFVKDVEDPANTGFSPEGFQFEVYNWNGDKVSSGTSDKNGHIDFAPELVFTEAGIYHYRVVEVNTDENGVRYDTTVWAVTVTVRYDAVTGYLSIANVYYGVKDSNTASTDGITFVNTYDPTSAQVTLTMNKTLVGRELKEGEFTFRLMSGTTVVAETTNTADGKVIFNLTYDQVGEYVYTVVEVNGETGGIHYDSSIQTVKVTVTDDREAGKLVAVAVVTDGDGTFENTYSAAGVDVTFTARKRMVGRTLWAGEFTFLLTDANGKVIEAANAADGTVNFGTITYTEAGTYTYTITEKAGTAAGVTYSKRVYTATVTVTDDLQGKLHATVVYTYQDSAGATQTIVEPLFANVYAATGTQVELTAFKVLEGRLLKANEFTFVLTDEDGNTTEAGNAADGSVTFGTIAYTEAGTYTYTITEKVGGLGGVSYSELVYHVTVTVTDDGKGQLVATVVYSLEGTAVDKVVFTNHYTPEEISLILTGTKYLTGAGADGIGVDEFSFDVYVYDVTTGTVGALISGGATVAGEGSASIHFAPIGFNLEDMTDDQGKILASKDFYFLVVEDIPGANGPAFDPNMYYDTTEYLVKVTVRYDAEKGVLSVSEPVYSILGGGSATALSFTNIQQPASVEVTPIGNKTTTNAPDGITFSFSVINKATGHEAGVGVGAANGAITFTTLSFTQPGTYVYTIQEANAGNTTNGITYDDAVYTMTIVVTRDAYNKLVATVTYTNENGESVSAPAFHNAYNAAGYINITAKKQLDGRELNAGEFAFKLVRKDNGGEIDGIVAADGTITFATMYYSLADIPAGKDTVTIHYVMSEVIPDQAKLPGISYDTTAYDVYITIVDNGDGTIRAFLSDKDGKALASATDTGIVFKNSYSVTTGTEVTIQVDKILNGRELQEGEFSFMLYRYDGVNGWKNVATALNAADGSVSFIRYFNAATLDSLAFEDTYTIVYRIDEVNNHLGGVSYDTKSIYVKVVIRHDENSASYLVDSIGYYSDEACQNELTNPTFENTYHPAGTTLIPEANKVLNGRELMAGEFAFVIVDENGNVVSNGTVDASGKIIFTAISFTKAGEYTFTMKEVAGTLGGVTYDGNGYEFTVQVIDHGHGVLYAVAEYPNGGITFTNTYKAADVQVGLEAFKTLTGRLLQAGEFTFLLTDANGKVIEATNAADGTVTFGNITFTEAGTYTYTITEKAGTVGGVTYSNLVYTVTVTVTDNGAGQLVATAAYSLNGNTVEAAIFTNTYKAADVQVGLEAFKTLTGRLLQAGEFTFVLTDANGKVIEATNAADGTVHFGIITYTEAGTYTYTITEKAGTLGGVTYSELVYTVTVTVTDNGAGQLVATAVYSLNGNAVESATFTNTYEAADVQVALEAFKTLTGRLLKADEFTFVLTDAAGNTVEATNAADGTVRFGDLTFTKAGIYVYAIHEKSGEAGGITYSDLVYVVTITVTDNGAGQLEAAVVYELNGETVETAVFVNNYAAGAVGVTLEATKVLQGKTLEEGAFTFVLTDEKGNTIEATNAADGTIRFEGLVYTAEGVYLYTLSEIKGDDVSMVYDETVYSILVTVVDNGEGSLEIASVMIGDQSLRVTDGVVITGIAFVNIYDPLPETGDNGIVMPMLIMTASVTALAVLLLAQKKRRVNG